MISDWDCMIYRWLSGWQPQLTLPALRRRGAVLICVDGLRLSWEAAESIQEVDQEELVDEANPYHHI